jgi:hypothetical protein
MFLFDKALLLSICITFCKHTLNTSKSMTKKTMLGVGDSIWISSVLKHIVVYLTSVTHSI